MITRRGIAKESRREPPRDWWCELQSGPERVGRRLNAARSIHVKLEVALRLLGDCVEIDERTRSGVAVFRGTRIPLAQLFAELRDGETLEGACSDMGLEVEAAKAVLDAVGAVVNAPLRSRPRGERCEPINWTSAPIPTNW